VTVVLPAVTAPAGPAKSQPAAAHPPLTTVTAGNPH
jgi:hypothetical protein